MATTLPLERGISLGGTLDRRDGRPGWEVRPRHLAAIATECPRGCTHLPDAPDCALIEAVAAGELGERGPARLESLQRLLLTIAERDAGDHGGEVTPSRITRYRWRPISAKIPPGITSMCSE